MKQILTFIFLGQTTAACPTAIWNNTFNVIAGITGVSSSTGTALSYPYDLFIGANNTLYVSDTNNNRIQRFASGSATGVTIPNLSLSSPVDIYVDNTGVIYISDLYNYRVLRWANNVVTTVAGGRGSSSAYNAIGQSYNIYVDASSNIYVSDCGNHRVTFWAAGNPNTSQLVLFLFKFYRTFLTFYSLGGWWIRSWGCSISTL